jgi:diguanylate cyclase (GGDEF)-like protein
MLANTVERETDTASRSEQRRHVRIAVTQSALLSIGEQLDIQCEIQDFCQSGLFLRFNTPEDALKLIGQKEKSLKISFIPPDVISQQTIEIQARLARRSPDGIGVAFVSNEREAIRALHKISMATHAQRITLDLHQNEGKEEVKRAARLLLTDFMGIGIRHFIESIQARLGALSERIQSSDERRELIHKVEELRTNFIVFKERFDKGIDDSLSHIESDQRENEIQEGIEDLSIVGEEEFEDWLNATDEASKIEERFHHELNNLEPRLEQLYVHPLDMRVNPYGPTSIFRVFSTALRSVSQSAGVKQAAYETLGQILPEHLAGLYQKLDEILPVALDVPRIRKQLSGPINDRHERRYHMPMTESLDKLAEMLIGKASHHTQGDQGRMDDGNTKGRMAQALMSLFRRNKDASIEAHSDEVAAEKSHQGVVIGSPLPYAGKVIHELALAGALPAGAEGQVQNSVDIFSTLVSAMGAERSISAEIRPFMRRIEESLLKLAIQDPKFLDTPNHPAHRTLNAIDRLSQVSSEDGEVKDGKLIKLINRWTERIRAEAAVNPSIYDEARIQLEKVLEPLLRARLGRIARLQEALEGWQKTSQAKRAISREIEQRLPEGQVPVVAQDLLNAGWRNYLTRARLRNSYGDEEEKKAWESFDQVLAWLNIDSDQEIDRLQVHYVLQYIDSCLSVVSADRHEQERAIDRLAHDLLYTKDRSAIAYTTLNTTNGSMSDADMNEEERDSLEGLRVGDWFLSEQMPEPLNLVWIGDDPPMYVFANYRGVKKFDAKPIDLAKRITSGEFSRTDSLELPLIDRSFSSMVQHMHRSLIRQAILDPATGLIKQKEFMRRVRQTWLRAGTSNCGYAIGVMDFDDLRLYQSQIDAKGMNELLNQLGIYLKSRMQNPDLFARCGEWIFAYLVEVNNYQEALSDAERLVSEVSKFNFVWNGQRFPLTVNIGLAWSVDCLDSNKLYTKADEACITSKHDGRNRINVYREDDLAHQQEGGLVYWASNINKVLSDNRLTLRCQPIMPIHDVGGMPSHYEVLLGIPQNTGESISVGEFVASVERLKRGNELDRWVFDTVFDWIRRNPSTFERIGSFSVNVSGQSIGSKGFFDYVNAELAKGEIPGHKLIFEITESAAIDSFAHAETFVRHLRRYGCRFSLDDFGVGFSSYSYLKKLKVDYLKIDGSFVRDMLRNEVDVALISSMNETSRLLGIKTIAESVENEETLNKLREIGVDYVQGYHTGRPIYIDSLIGP